MMRWRVQGMSMIRKILRGRHLSTGVGPASKIGPIRESTVRAFERDGAVCLRGVVGPEWINQVRKGIAENAEKPGIGHERLAAEGGGGVFWNDYCSWTTIDPFRSFVLYSGVAELARSLMQSRSVCFYHEHVLVKEPGAHSPTPWHQDQTYYPFEGHMVSLWMPCDPVPLESTLRFVRGSHLHGAYIPRKFATLEEYTFNQGAGACSGDVDYKRVPRDIDSDPDSYPVLQWAVDPGDVVAFDGKTLHAANGNHLLDTARRVVSWRFLADDAVFVERPWELSPPVTGNLQPGQRPTDVNDPTFPLL